ncbi:LUD domain-containing protein [Hippea alviniae]|uniref:LUD domain-containing protein n=1 Tax=Hippea alviniae TaxID=1279027 RepID=UPI0003B78C4D|nr:LUD domain-containing protein [Hippea alviniae]
MTLEEREKEFSEDSFLQTALLRLRENYFSKREKIEKLFDIEELKNKVRSIKERNIEKLSENLKNFIEKIKANSDAVFVAKDKQEALSIVESILKENQIKSIVKSKSLTTEELHLNEFLAENGFEVYETDLGEWLVQINNEPPTHMTAPAIHMSKEKINQLLNSVFNENLPNDAKVMVDFSKEKIKETFSKADCGIIGANVVSAESGSFFILSNEGNIQNVIRQDTVICFVGIDKIVETDREAFKIIELLPKAATAQITTSYIDILRKPYGKFYVILLDNGRSSIKNNEFYKEILYCIRCGACQNACPVYTTVSGKLFKGKSYAGPIGILLSYMVGETEGLRDYANMCIGCMACDEICSSKINLQKLILSIKAELTKDTPGIKGLIIKHLENRYEVLRIGAYISHFAFKNGLKTGIKKIDEALGLNFRALPPITSSFDVSVKTKKSKICLFAGCSVNFIYSNIGKDALEVAKKLGIELTVIKQSACCGAPAWYNGEKKSAQKAARINIDYLLSLDCDKILFLDPHCAHMIERDYKILTENPRALELSHKVECASSYFIQMINSKHVKTSRLGAVLGYHHPCHLKRGLEKSTILDDFLKSHEPNYVEIENNDRCCGFAGSYSMMHPHISKRLLEEKIESIKKANLQVLITACPGCIMQISGGLKVKGIRREVLHFVSYLNRIL